MKNSIIFILVLIFLTGCGEVSNLEEEESTQFELDSNLLIGCWYLDSSSYPSHGSDRLFINENFDYYVFSRSNGGGLIDYGQIPFRDSALNRYGTMNYIELLDSFTLKKTWRGWVQNEDFYNKMKHVDVSEELDQAFQQDSLRSLIIGWWKLKKAKYMIKLPNALNGDCEKVTMQIKDDGNVVFYKENQLDSAVSYNYNTRENGISLSRGCVSSWCYSYINENKQLRFLMDYRFQDTLLFERIFEIN